LKIGKKKEKKIMKNNMIISEEELQDFDEQIHQEIADWLNDYISDKAGFCHKGFRFEIHVKDIKWDKTN
jgi:hypothetical protein